jgi:hypothetical protein
MNIISSIKNICSSLYNLNFVYRAKVTHSHCQPKTIPQHVRENICPFATQRETSNGLCHRKITSNKSSLNRINQPFPILKPISPQIHQASLMERPDNSLIQTLHYQINQLQKENNSIFSQISIKPTQQSHVRFISPLNSLTSNENMHKFEELTKWDIRLQNLSNFCNEEMIEVLHLVMEAIINLESKIDKLYQKSSSIEDDFLLIENIEHIKVLESTVEALHQLESKFQTMLLTDFNKQPAQILQEEKISSLLEEIEYLNVEKQLLKECQEKLPLNKAYDSNELQILMKSFLNENVLLNKNINISKQKLNKAKQFGKELTNHLLDYAEILNVNFQKMQRVSHQTSQPVLTPLLNQTLHQMSMATRQSKIEAIQPESFNSHGFMCAANEVALALKNLLELDKS